MGESGSCSANVGDVGAVGQGAGADSRFVDAGPLHSGEASRDAAPANPEPVMLKLGRCCGAKTRGMHLLFEKGEPQAPKRKTSPREERQEHIQEERHQSKTPEGEGPKPSHTGETALSPY